MIWVGFFFCLGVIVFLPVNEGSMTHQMIFILLILRLAGWKEPALHTTFSSSLVTPYKRKKVCFKTYDHSTNI